MGNNSWKLIMIPQVDTGVLPLCLSSPNKENSGGYIRPGMSGQTIYDYSPIDLVVAGVEAALRDLKITNLINFFNQYSERLSDSKITIGLKYDTIFIYSLFEWKLFVKHYNMPSKEELARILINNAPLTFRGII